MRLNIFKRLILLFLIAIIHTSCEEFVEIDAPNNILVRNEVFNNEQTAKSAMTGIYNELFLADFSSGSRSSVTLLAGLSADNIGNINTNNQTLTEFDINEISPSNENNYSLWSSAYNIIYMTNSFLEGLSNSQNVSVELAEQLEGEARFIRAFTYFYLVNLYGDVPLILNTNYESNKLASRNSKDEVYFQIQEDLELAILLLDTDYRNQERTTANKYSSIALSARVNLYLENWQEAERLSSEVIGESAKYEILPNLDEVFLANSREAIWQISPIGGGGIVTHTNEGILFIIDPVFSFFANFQLESDFVNSFQDQDLRNINWIGYNEGKDAFFPYKYKIRYSAEFPIQEYSMVLRLSEQYLIRAEARAQQDNIQGAIEDLNIIRHRAGLDPIESLYSDLDRRLVLDEVLLERSREFFAEWGHHWLDLKRTGKAKEFLSVSNLTWDDTDTYYPIPAEERSKNTNLTQNAGY